MDRGLFRLSLGALPDGQGIYDLGNTSYHKTLDATTDHAAICFVCQEDMTVADVGIICSSVTGSPDYIVSIQGLTTAGVPDGTILGGGSPASAGLFTPSVGINWVTLDNTIALTQGTEYAIVIEDDVAGTAPDGSNFFVMPVYNTQIVMNLPCSAFSSNSGSTWARDTYSMPFWGIRASSTDVQGNPIRTYADSPSGAAVTTIGDVSGFKFKIPGSLGRRVKCSGLTMAGWSSGDYIVGIYEDNDTLTAIAESPNIDLSKGILSSTSMIIEGHWDSVWLETEVWYYAGIKLNSSGGLWAYVCTLDAAGTASAFTNYPNSMSAEHLTAWTDYDSRVPSKLSLIISDFDAHGQEMQHLAAGMTR